MSDPQATFVTSEECWAKEFDRIVVDNSNGAQELNQKLDMLAEAALQNDKLDFSSIKLKVLPISFLKFIVILPFSSLTRPSSR